MKMSRCTEEQIITILREAATGEPTIGHVCRAYGIGENTCSTWRKKYGGVDVAAVKRLRELEQEHARLKRLLAERDLELDAGTLWVKDVLAKKGRARNSDVTPCRRCVHAACHSVGVARCATSAVPVCATSRAACVVCRMGRSWSACSRLPANTHAMASGVPMRSSCVI